MRFPYNCLIIGITVFAATPALRAQDTVIIPCDGSSVGETYCYNDSDEHVWHWQSECGAPIILQFSSGMIESSLYDQLRIFDGPDVLAPLVYVNGSNPGNVDLTGLQFVGSSGDLYMHMTSNATNCCATDGFRDTGWQWIWSVSSGTVGINEEEAGNFSLYPNPATSTMRVQGPANGTTEIRILDVTGRVVYHSRFEPSGTEPNSFELQGLQSGRYSVALSTPNWVKVQQLQVIR